jgi:tetratricopeptide (TPR) repeat protein
MQALATIVGAVVLSCAGSYAVVAILAPAPQPAPQEPAAIQGSPQDLQQGLDSLGRTLKELNERLARLEVRENRVAVPAVSDEQVRQAVADWMARNAKGERGAAPAAAAKKDAPAPVIDFDAAIAKLAGPSLPNAEREKLMGELVGAGLIDRVVGAFELRARENPGVADRHAQLGDVYIQKLMTVSNDVEKGTWAIKADHAWDRALELEPTHWKARFSKATSLSFYPPIMGKGAEAVKHFETLVQQQEASGVRQEHYAQTYVFLGNLYEQQGKADQAREVWQRGYKLFPQNDDLKGRLAQK